MDTDSFYPEHSSLVFVTVCFVSGGGGAGRRPGSGGKKVEQKNPADASWPPGVYMLILDEAEEQHDILLLQERTVCIYAHILKHFISN